MMKTFSLLITSLAVFFFGLFFVFDTYAQAFTANAVCDSSGTYGVRVDFDWSSCPESGDFYLCVANIPGPCEQFIYTGSGKSYSLYNLSKNLNYLWSVYAVWYNSFSEVYYFSTPTCLNLPCTLPWGGSLSSGSSITAYSVSSVACGSDCSSVSQTLTCTNSALNYPSSVESCSVQNCPPTPSNTGNSALIVTQPNYCLTGPAATFSWPFYDPDGDTQSAYQVQADNNSDFSSPEVDSGVVSSASNAYASGSGRLVYNITYYWRVMVWDSHGLASSWMNGPDFTTPKHVYPTVNFKASPPTPSAGEVVQFTDLTNAAVAVTAWAWNISNATYEPGSSASSQNPAVKFTESGTRTATLAATDADGYQCSNADNMASLKSLKVMLPLPGWKETRAQ